MLDYRRAELKNRCMLSMYELYHIDRAGSTIGLLLHRYVYLDSSTWNTNERKKVKTLFLRFKIACKPPCFTITATWGYWIFWLQYSLSVLDTPSNQYKQLLHKGGLPLFQGISWKTEEMIKMNSAMITLDVNRLLKKKKDTKKTMKRKTSQSQGHTAWDS